MRPAFHAVRACLAPVWLLAACQTAPLSRGPSEWRQLRLGLCEDYPEETRTAAAARADLQFTRDSGAAVLRIAFGWDAMEPERGRYDWSFWDDYVRLAAEQYHVELIPYVCYTPHWAATDPGPDYWRSPPRDPADFARFVAALVSRYRPWIHSWELWNEPDNEAYWLGTPAQLAELVRAGARAVRREDPSARVVLGGLAGKLDYLETLFRDERLAPAVDVVNVHSYFETWHPDPIEQLPHEIERAAGIVARYGENEPLWMAETGYSTVGPRDPTSGVYRPRYDNEHTGDAQADALIRTVVLAAGTGRLSTVAWYRINDLPAGEIVIGDDNNRHLGVLATNRRPKPAAAAFARLAALFRQPYRVLPVGVEIETGAADATARAFQFQDGRCVVFAWNPMEGSAPAGRPIGPDSRVRRVRLRFTPEGPAVASSLDFFGGGPGPAVHARGRETEIALVLTGSTVRAVELRARSRGPVAPQAAGALDRR